MVIQEFKVGDYVEVIELPNNGIELGEQGIVIGHINEYELDILFPISIHNNGTWAKGERLACANYGWSAGAKQLKLVYRPEED